MAGRPKQRKKPNFKVGDLVLAKMKGYPPWPAKIIDVPQSGNIKVKFYQTGELSKGYLQLTLWDASFRPPENRKKDESLLGAYDLCHAEFHGTNGNPTEEPQKVAPKTEKRGRRARHTAAVEKTIKEEAAEPGLSVEVNSELTNTRTRTRTKTKTKLDIKPKAKPQPESEPEPEPEPDQEPEQEPDQEPDQEPEQDPEQEPEQEPEHKPQHEPEFKSESSSSPETNVIEPKLPDRVRSPKPIKIEANDKHTKKLNANTVDCSLNDLTSERANADRGIKRKLPKSSITHENIETRTIEKLKKKLQRKLDEKEIKKRNRIEKKIFDKASNIWQRKFIPKFLSLSQMCEQFVAKPNDKRNANQLVTSMKSCVDEKNLDLLNKCVEPLGSHYGRAQEESKGYHQAIERMVSCVKKVKGTNLKPTSKEAKHLLGQLKANPNIKQFINSFKEWTSEQTKEEFIVERKENAQKRRKLTC